MEKYYSYSSHRIGKVEIIKPSQIQFLSSGKRKIPYEPNKYLYSHVTVVPAVKTTDKGYIEDGYEGFVNTHGDCIPEPVLSKFGKTFLESNVFFEHLHLSELIKGKVFDYVLYNVPVPKVL